MLVAGYLGFGALAAAHDIPLAIAVALATYFWLTRRNLFAGVLAGAVALCLLRA